MKKIAKFITVSNNDHDDISQRIFTQEYRPQMINLFENEFHVLQKKLSKDMLPWIAKRFDDYNVQRYIQYFSEDEKKDIKDKIGKLTHRLILDVIGTLHKIK